jgi:tetratricopeptide (TPR) repeat protein
MNAHFERTRMLLELKRYTDAEKEVALALAIDPNDSTLHAWRAVCLLERGARQEAFDAALQAIAADPENAYAHYTSSRIANRLGWTVRALDAIRESLRLAPTDADYHYYLGAIEFGRDRWGEALEAVEAALEHLPDHVPSANLRALCLARLGMPTEAIAAIDRALAIDPEYAWSHENRATLALADRDVERAFRHFREALRLNPRSEAARDGLIESLKSRHRTYRALFWLFGSSSEEQREGPMVFCFFAFAILSALFGVLKEPLAAIIASGILTVVGFWAAKRIFRHWAEPFFLFLLRFDDLGRRALSADEVRRANLATLSIATSVGLIAAAFVLRMPLLGILAVIAIFAPHPLNFIFGQPSGVLRLWAAVDYLGLILMSILLVLIPFVGPIVAWSGVPELHVAMVRRADMRRRKAGL